MKAALIFGPGDMRVVDRPDPEPAADEVVVRVAAYSPYGTDVGHFIDRGGRYEQHYPVGVGADFSGVVEKLGSEVDNVRVGDRVSALALNHCGKCDNCRAGRTNLCRDRSASTRPRQACCQTLTTVAANKLAVLPANVSFEEAGMLSGFVVALNAFELLGIGEGDLLAVIGVGAMGQSAIAAAKACGIRTIAIGGTGARADIAERLGAEAVFRLATHGEMATDRVLAATPRGYTHILETTASQWGVTQAIAVASLEGRVALTGGGPLPATAWDLVLRELKLLGVNAGHHQEQALALIAAGKLDLKPAITHRFTLDEAPAAFALLAGPDASDVGRVIITIGD